MDPIKDFQERYNLHRRPAFCMHCMVVGFPLKAGPEGQKKQQRYVDFVRTQYALLEQFSSLPPKTTEVQVRLIDIGIYTTELDGIRYMIIPNKFKEVQKFMDSICPKWATLRRK